MKTEEEITFKIWRLVSKLRDKRVAEHIKDNCVNEIRSLLWVLEDSEVEE